jgi:hypothetical protein
MVQVITAVSMMMCVMLYFVVFFSNSKIRPMAFSGFYEFRLLHGLPGPLCRLVDTDVLDEPTASIYRVVE